MENKHTGSSLWGWVIAAFLLLLIAWGVMFTVASKTHITPVPLEAR